MCDAEANFEMDRDTISVSFGVVQGGGYSCLCLLKAWCEDYINPYALSNGKGSRPCNCSIIISRYYSLKKSKAFKVAWTASVQ